MIDCHACKPKDRWNCIGKPHYTYGEIIFCPRQIYFIIENFLLLEKDNFVIKDSGWPADPTSPRPDESVYITKRVSKEAKFCKPMEIVAEVRNRLSKCERNGKLLVVSIMGGLAMENLPGDAWLTLLYISGWRRKRISFSQWRYKRERNYVFS